MPDQAERQIIEPIHQKGQDPCGPDGVDHVQPKRNAHSGIIPSADDHRPADGALPLQEVDDELLTEFISESNGLVAKAEWALLSLEADPEDRQAVDTVFRAFHSIKGASGFLGLTTVVELSHHAENLLSRIREGKIRYRGGYADLALRALDMIKMLLLNLRRRLPSDAAAKPEGFEEFIRILIDPEGGGMDEDSDDMAFARVGDILVAQGRAARDRVEEAVSRDSLDPIGVRLVRNRTASLIDVGQALRAQQLIKRTEPVGHTSIRVSRRRLDRLVDAVEELAAVHSMAARDEAILKGRYPDMAEKFAHSGRIVRELQALSMSMQMMPLRPIVNKMARLVRDLAGRLGKQVAFAAEGEDTEIHRSTAGAVADALMHIIRNAVDHGIEGPRDRMRRGKNARGTIKLSARQAGACTVIEVSDDGRGIDRTTMLRKAIEKGLILQAGAPGDEDLCRLIFEPGFSTATAVTDISGRGVGMDVVKTSIESLNGRVEVDSENGVGSVFRLKLPPMPAVQPLKPIEA